MMISWMAFCVNRFFKYFLDTPFGHACGVRVDGAAPRELWPPASGRLCSLALRGQGERFLGLTGLMAGGFLSLTAFQAEGCGIALTGDEYKVSVTDSPFCVIWHDKHSADWLAALASPYPASPDFPRKRGQNKTPRNTLLINGSTVSTDYCATVEVLHRTSTVGRSKAPNLPIKALSFCRPTELRGWQRNWIHRGAPRPANPVTCFPPGKVVAPAAKGGENAFSRAKRGWPVSLGRSPVIWFFRQRRYKKWRPIGRPPRQRSGAIYLPRAEPSTRPGGVSRSRTEPLAPRARGPAAPSTLARESGRQPSGIQVPCELTKAISGANDSPLYFTNFLPSFQAFPTVFPVSR